mgnify:CR=1 FL=1
MKFTLLSTLAVLLLMNGSLWAQDSTLIQFELKDQFGRDYDETSFENKIIILLGADRKGSQYTDLWGPTLADSLRQRGIIDSVEFVALADLRAVPGLMRGIVKGYFPDAKDKWVLMDWRGVFPQAYDFVDDSCNLLIFDPQQRLMFQQAVTDYDPRVAKQVLRAVQRALQ